MDNILAFLAARATGIKQRTPEWLEAKALRIGGSSFGIITGDNPYDGVASLIFHDRKFGSIRPLVWGQIFEEMMKRITELRLGTTIVGDDEFILHNDPALPLGYSPDGLGIVGGAPVLFEFKCPITRRITGTVPPYYLAQVRMGLDIIPIAEHGLYIEGKFKIEALDDAPGGSWYGTISFVGNNPTLSPVSLSDDEANIDLAFEGVENGTLCPVYSPPERSAGDDIYPLPCPGSVWYACWTLVACKDHIVPRVPSYIEGYREKILLIGGNMSDYHYARDKKAWRTAWEHKNADAVPEYEEF